MVSAGRHREVCADTTAELYSHGYSHERDNR